MPVYMCRWENGEVCFLSAKSKKDACLLLDEFAEVEPDDLHPVSDFMLSFKLTTTALSRYRKWVRIPRDCSIRPSTPSSSRRG